MNSIVAFCLIVIFGLIIATIGVPLKFDKGPFDLHRIVERSPTWGNHGYGWGSSSSESHERRRYPSYSQQYPGYPQQYPGYSQQGGYPYQGRK